ncbi:unnamed protein product [Somion occarium]|uniref:laccase n=1 Tax=Somion occarium TaxID=3059160 RepID=A0ABP1DPS2_9APHY
MSLFPFTCIVAAFVLSLPSLASIGPITDLLVVDAAVSPDGFTRQAVLANGVFPGPLISGKKGDNFKINVVNELTNADMLNTTTIHWHGIFQSGTNWADGPAFVNQCPIASGNSFLYDFSVPNQAGTFWYHSHISTQYCDGLRGPLIIYDPRDPHRHLYDIDNEGTVITLADWLHTMALKGPQFPTPDSTLINGKGRFHLGPPSELAVITVHRGKRYRFRLVAMSCEPTYTFNIDHHSMNVIEVDGVNHEPVEVDSLQILAGQRYSFVVNADQPVGNYWIRAEPNFGLTGFENGVNTAILRYVGAPPIDPKTKPNNCSRLLNEVDLHPLEHPGAPGKPFPGGADLALNLDFGFVNSTPASFTVNSVAFVAPTVPVLLQILSGAQSPNDLLPSGSIYTLPSNSVIEISMPGGVIGGGHPIHLHGHTFDIVRSVNSSTYNYKNPVRRDVVNIGTTGDNVTIRFETNNPGPWFLHCHIDWHLQAGFAIVLAEAVSLVTTSNPVPESWEMLCPDYDGLT